jgi:hypothetical protein
MAKIERKTLPLWQQLRNKCQHFNGLINDTCDAGVAYADVRDESQRPYAFPCLIGETSASETRPVATTVCERADFLTDAQAQAQADETMARIRARFDREAQGFCGQCDRKVERKAQVGPCIYNEPCGCRVGQGRLKR